MGLGCGGVIVKFLILLSTSLFILDVVVVADVVVAVNV